MKTVILLTKAEAKAISKEFKRNKVGGTFSLRPHDDQTYKTGQTGVNLVHYSYQVTEPQLRFIRARARRPSGVLVRSAKYGNRRAFPEPRKRQVEDYLEYIEQNFQDRGHQGVAVYIQSVLRRARTRGARDVPVAIAELKSALGSVKDPRFDSRRVDLAFKDPSFRVNRK